MLIQRRFFNVVKCCIYNVNTMGFRQQNANIIFFYIWAALTQYCEISIKNHVNVNFLMLF